MSRNKSAQNLMVGEFLAFLGPSLKLVKEKELKSVWQGSAEGFQSKTCELVSGKLT